MQGEIVSPCVNTHSPFSAYSPAVPRRRRHGRRRRRGGEGGGGGWAEHRCGAIPIPVHLQEFDDAKRDAIEGCVDRRHQRVDDVDIMSVVPRRPSHPLDRRRAESIRYALAA